MILAEHAFHVAAAEKHCAGSPAAADAGFLPLMKAGLCNQHF